LARAIKTTGISMFVRAAAGLRDTAALRLCRDAAAGVIFSGQNLCRAQSQNCETGKTHVSAEINMCDEIKTLLPIIVGGAIGIAGSIIAPTWLEYSRRKHERESLTGAFVGEISAVIEICKRRQYIENIRALVTEAKARQAEPNKSVWFHFSIRRNPFPVYDANVTRLGLLKDPLPRQIARFYTQSSSILEDIADMREGKIQRNRDESIRCLEALLELFEDTQAVGEKIVLDAG
jgi:hypothetical protein